MPNLKLAVRMLFKAPFVTLVAIVSLAFGIGANAAIFSLFDQMLLRPLPVAEPARLVNLLAPGPKPGQQSCNQASTRGNCDDVFSYPMFWDLERIAVAGEAKGTPAAGKAVFTGLAAHRTFGANLAYRGQTASGQGMFVSGSYFPVLGLTPALGRLIGPVDEPSLDASPVVVLSHAYWQTRFAADPNVLNETMTVNGQTMTIVGVAPRGFDGTTLGSTPKVFVPMTMRARLQPTWKRFEDRRSYSLYLFARLAPGVTREQAQAALDPQYRAILNEVEAPLQKDMSPQTLERFRSRPLVLEPGSRGQSGVPNDAGPSLRLLLGVTALVLVIACANIANLLLARSTARAGEIAIRLSIGAGRGQLVAQLLAESLLLAAIGGAAGIVVAQWTLNLFASLLPQSATQGIDWHIDTSVMLFSAALAVGTGLLFGLFPAIHSTRPDLASALKGQAGQPSGARAAARFRTSLATAQIALSLALLVGAGLFTRSLLNVSRVNLGIDPDNVATFSISPSLNGYSPGRSLQLFEQLEDDLRATPGVTAATDSLVPMLAGDNWGNDVSVEGFPAGPDTDTNSRYNEVSAGYFRTMGIPLVAGREFTRSDAKDAAKVVVVNEAFAKKFNLGRDAVGRRIGNRGKTPDMEIVGVIQNAKYSEVKRDIPPVYYRPVRQGDAAEIGSVNFYVRSSLAPESILALIPRIVAARDPNLPVEDLRTLREQIRQNVFLDRTIGVLSAAFASLATLLAGIGLYGVIAYTVAQRTREIGLRMALGADAGRVRRMVLKQVAAMTVAGGAIGLAAAFALGRAAQSLLFQMKGSDPVVLTTAVAALAGVALAAGFIPAARAARVDPMTALRYE